MISNTMKNIGFLCAAGVAALVMAGAPSQAQTPGQMPAQMADKAPAPAVIDPDAAKVLAQMQAYLSGLKSFTAKYDADFDVLTPRGEKLKFLSAGDIAVARPGHLHVTRTGAIADIRLFLDGKTLTLYGAGLNAFLQVPAASIDEAVDIVRDQLGFPAPGADLIVSKPFDFDTADLLGATHVGMEKIGDQMVHHLAFQGAHADWQIWVKDGDQPLPLRYVITSKWTTGAPEYSLRLSDWNVAPKDDPSVFAFTPPAGAKKLSALVISETGEIVEIQE